MLDKSTTRVAWLFPSLALGNYWHPIFSKFTQTFQETTVYTGCWSGFTQGYEGTFTVQVVGKAKRIETNQSSRGYKKGFDYLSPNIIGHLVKFKPQVIFTSAFSLWSLLATLLKPLFKWRIIIVYDGSSPTIDASDSKSRILLRRFITHFADAFITNNQLGKQYLVNRLKAKTDLVFARPYQVPDIKALSVHQSTEDQGKNQTQQNSTFLFVGQIVPRKGIHLLLKTCTLLQAQGYDKYKLIVVGDGSQKSELEEYCNEHGLKEHVQWLGWLEYSKLSDYFDKADVFIFPTLEDVWGMVILEAMAFGKPILCSKWAGASSMVVEGENGYIFDPNNSEKLAELMKCFIDNQDIATSMGKKSKKLISLHTPETATKFLIEVVQTVLSDNN